MSRTPAHITQADVARVIRAAMQCCAPAVDIIKPDVTIRVILCPETIASEPPAIESKTKVVL